MGVGVYVRDVVLVVILAMLEEVVVNAVVVGVVGLPVVAVAMREGLEIMTAMQLATAAFSELQEPVPTTARPKRGRG